MARRTVTVFSVRRKSDNDLVRQGSRSTAFRTARRVGRDKVNIIESRRVPSTRTRPARVVSSRKIMRRRMRK